ncbi:TPA: helix-turn-helix transcriptional regulator [Streptococcus suis]|uniref:Phage repressor protein n=1 Tax=Streptococcus suis TaxID=1307 RepID=A0A0Z8C7B4_STRSU|nr:XRE family transcriptional regulator [Streptococcus suis]MCK4041549.1 helix-turn-helix transcriptional regulator [Streptococcus suis]NQI12491.1 helix-turn-helix transcriptional regulator [Streptococcus suis]CYU20113.1 phage repressor protein [Streptococcus suis]HEL2274377.1 helix-turn-helix transcriptional regulator [Streptococcus suis]HEL2602747.1 helix-turn-helix transcriptional regulator [Streptococcus suis]
MFSPKRLKEKRTELGLSQSEIARQLEISRMSYSAWERGKTKPNQKNLSLLATILKVDESFFESEYSIVQNYLLLTDENKLAAEDYVEQLLTSQSIAENVVSIYSYQVLSDIQLSAGPGEGLYDEFETETVYSEDEYTGFDIATWISGNSMEPVYKDGEVALIRSTGFDYDGAVYALNWNGSLYIKKLYREEDGFRMVSLNEDYTEKFIPYEDEPRIVGLVVGHFMPVIGG